MFKKITLKNYRSHKLTTIDINPITLLIGNNNSGKSNILTGIQHFCGLVRRGRPDRKNRNRTVVNIHRDFYPYIYRLAGDDDPMGFSINWANLEGEVEYEIELYKIKQSTDEAFCREKINIRLFDGEETKQVTSGYNRPLKLIALRETIENETSLSEQEKQLCKSFFGNFASTYSYHFQPTFLKGIVRNGKIIDEDLDENSQNESNEVFRTGYNSGIASKLGENGGNFQEILREIKENDERTFTRFTALMRSFEPDFEGVRYNPKRERLIWEFNFGRRGTVEEFAPDVLSDGFMKAAAISLLASLRMPPALILLEEIENGINPGNIQKLMNWIWQMTSPIEDGYTSQFIITSHSPSVLREFNDYLDHVYTVRLDKRSRKSDVRNLNTVLDNFVGVGQVEGEIIENEDGKRLVKIPKKELTEIWYSTMFG